MISKTKKLTKSVVDALTPTGKLFRLFDSEVKGFSVRVGPSGDKRWQLDYRPHPGGRDIPKKRLTIGAVSVLTPDEARARARATLAEIAKGNDPVADKIAARNEKTVADLIDLYEEKGSRILRGKRRGQPMKPRNKAYTINALRHHVVPLIGSKRVSKVTVADIDDMARAITAGKTAKDETIGPRRRIIVKGGPGAARRVLRCLSAVFTFAIDREIVSSNPVQKAPVDKIDNRRTRFLDLDEVRRLGEALDALEAEGVNTKAIDIVRLWALTGCRRDEIAGLKWSEVDDKRACLRLDRQQDRQECEAIGGAGTGIARRITALCRQ